MDLQNCKYVEIRRREIWIVILGLKKPVIKKLFHVSSTSTFRAVFLILINITKILNNLLGSNIKVWKVLLYTFHNSKRTFVVEPMEHCILNVEHIYLLTIYLPSQIVMFLLALSRYGEHLKSSFEIPKYHGSIPLLLYDHRRWKKKP